jgi:hypothetical protein
MIMLNRICASLFIVTSGIYLMAQPTIHIDYQCDSAMLWINSPQADSTVYYWQGSTCGTDKSLFDTTYKVLTTGTFYLREYSTASSNWVSTSCASAIITLSQYPALPPVPDNSAGNLTFTDPPANIIYYNQGITCGKLMTSPGTVFPVSTSGTYYFNSFDTLFRCWSTACTDVNVVIISAIDNTKINSSAITVMPNPVIDRIQISIPLLIDNADLTIYDFTGRVVLTRLGIKNNESIDVSGLNQGNYIARFRNNEIDQSLKIIISR